MIITLSPAKILDFESKVSIKDSTTPLFESETKELYSLFENFSIDEIARLMKINSQLAHSTYEHIHSFNLEQTPRRQAGFAYNGIAYQGLDIATFSKEDLDFAQKHLVMFSGLYGILKPLDIIKPYRLEMQTKIKNEKGNTLYDFWRVKLSNYLAQVMKQNSNIWVNLSSNEYTKVIDRKLLPKGYQVITPIFKEARGDGFKQVVVYAKKARGMMARFIVQNKIEEADYLKAFNDEGYCYSEQLSAREEWVFIR